MLIMEEVAKAAKMRILDKNPLAENLTTYECKELSRKMKVLYESLANIDETSCQLHSLGRTPQPPKKSRLFIPWQRWHCVRCASGLLEGI